MSKSRFRLPFVILALTIIFSQRSSLSADDATSADDFAKQVDPFVTKYCYQCHGNAKEKGDLSLDQLGRDLSDAATAIAWQDAVDLVTLGEMPPPQRPQPSTDEIASFSAAVESTLKRITNQQAPTRIEIRRLSHSALQNTVEDLIGTRLSLVEGLPADTEVAGFDNLAQTLDLSEAFTSVLHTNARQIASNVITDPSESDPRQRQVYNLNKLEFGKRVLRSGDEFILASSRGREDAVSPLDFVAPHSGVYRIQIDAFQADNRDQLDAAGIAYPAASENSYVSTRQFEKLRLPSNRRRTAVVRAYIPSKSKKFSENSLRDAGKFFLTNKYDQHTIQCVLRKGETFYIAAVDCPRTNQMPYALVNGKEKLVGELMHIKRIGVEGPLLETWPSQTQQALLPNRRTSSNRNGGVRAFLTRAFRRPISKDLIKRYGGIYQLGISSGLTREAAMQNVIVAVLCSPRFLFNYQKDGSADAWALASRLSYFLWNSMPDDELFRLAASGKLLDRNVYDAQVRRMLADPKIDRLTIDFAGQWLGLRRVGAMPPDPRLYPEYDPFLEQSIRAETEALFREILMKNLPITDFLSPNFAMLNDRLARHYGIEGVEGPQIRRVALPVGSPRGGLLGHASILTITSNGSRTSPVVRGVWVLENLLDSPPSPPPADVKPIEPDVRGAKTIREMLAAHRDVESCNECHRRIDPWGFGLENFDAIGQWREHYRGVVSNNKSGKRLVSKQTPVDASGKFSDGKPFDGVSGLRDALLAKSDRFAHALTAKLLTHAVGHPPSAAERIEVEEIVEQNQENGGRLADLIVLICKSDVFRRPDSQ